MYVFISYSRKQFYFAEALMLQLDKQGIPVWFDMQRLVPGTAWQEGIDEGLVSCAALILVASRAALASDYVRKEWQTVLAANKSIYIVLFEAVELPVELQHATIIDMRAAFASKVDVLAESIRQGKLYRDRLPHVNPLYLPSRLPLSLAFIMGTLWIITLLSLAFTIVLAQVFLAITRPNSMDLPDCAFPMFGLTFHGALRTIDPFLTIAMALLLLTVIAFVLDAALLYRWYFPYAILYPVLFSPLVFFVSALFLKDATGHIATVYSTSLGSAYLSVGDAMSYFDSAFSWLLLFALPLFWLAARLMLCNISYQSFCRQLNIAMTGVFIAQFQFLGYFAYKPDLILLGGLMVAALIALWRVPDSGTLQIWLPERSMHLFTHDRTLAVPAWQQLWPSTLLYILLFVPCIFLSRIFFGFSIPSLCTL